MSDHYGDDFWFLFLGLQALGLFLLMPMYRKANNPEEQSWT